jgi:hypothetical protein
MFLMGLGALLVLGGILYMAPVLFGVDRLVARNPPARFATLWGRHGAACDSWGSERTGRAFSFGSRRGYSVGGRGQFLASAIRAA